MGQARRGTVRETCCESGWLFNSGAQMCNASQSCLEPHACACERSKVLKCARHWQDWEKCACDEVFCLQGVEDSVVLARSSPRAPLHPLWPSSVPVERYGATTRKGPQRRSDVHAATTAESSLPPPSSGSRIVSCRLSSCPHESTTRSPPQKNCATCVSLVLL